MRDIVITLIVLGSLPFIIKRPIFGAIMWIWISVMNPHSQGWGFARTMPFAAIIAGCAIISVLISKERLRLPRSPVVVAFILFVLWPTITLPFSINDIDYALWSRWNKIALMTGLVLVVLKTRRDIEWVIWTIVVSLGFYGTKGGIFTLATGGNYRVWGPADTFIEGNNEMALALIIVIPLIVYLRQMNTNKWARMGLLAMSILCAVAALGSYSRGALVAIGAMCGFLWLKSPHKARLGLVMVLLVPVLFAIMPSQWHERMDTIQTYDQDASAMGRINAWYMAFNLANDRPFGGGFNIYDSRVFALYAPDPSDVHAAHSIYFQVLGEHGWLGLILYLVLAGLTWRSASWVSRHTRNDPELRWAHQLVVMLKVCILGFGVGGTFLSLLYFDVPYFVMVLVVATRQLVEKRLAERRRDELLQPPSEPVPRSAA